MKVTLDFQGKLPQKGINLQNQVGKIDLYHVCKECQEHEKNLLLQVEVQECQDLEF